MAAKISSRLREIVNALPLTDGIRILEIGCGPGAAAREIAARIGNGHIMGIDRSEKAISQAVESSGSEISAGTLSFRVSKIEDFELERSEPLFDIAFAVRVGALDGRHPEIEKLAKTQIKKALKPTGRLYIDGGKPLKEVRLD
ncbi:methyltransferase domain-containing protein [Dyadobacter aurulentus]|uniref:methyltransferase domain-containing protein n=1 Tax=Dyadobacter sp. UC 10 TaxID=2605428 RepID=UPI0011F377E0|nr:methyltransferase domain-containing protein [Dyadobacter sp. UC 10]KAA0988684.1 methyltransferase domain-containing protein [Dyadobacter sp. UC 10]